MLGIGGAFCMISQHSHVGVAAMDHLRRVTLRAHALATLSKDVKLRSFLSNKCLAACLNLRSTWLRACALNGTYMSARGTGLNDLCARERSVFPNGQVG